MLTGNEEVCVRYETSAEANAGHLALREEWSK